MTTSNTITVAAAQIGTDIDIESNAKKIGQMIYDANDCHVQVLLFHEGCLTGYPNQEQVDTLDFERVTQLENDIRQKAEALGIAVLLGSTSRENGRILNDVLIIDETGRKLGRYAKTWRAGEPWYAAGSGPVIFRVAGVEATVMICHDLRYPELARLSVAAGAQIIFIANNESGLTAEHKLLGYRSMQISRATENYVYAVMANAPADPGNMMRSNSSHGNSMIIDPMGNVLDQAGSFEERLVTVDIDLSQATRQPPLRTLGEDPAMDEVYGVTCEHPAYAAWMKTGMKLVRYLDGRS